MSFLYDYSNKFYISTAFILSLGIYVTKRVCKGTICHIDSRLDGKTVLITGANAGIGAATAEDLARRGARVIMACRDMIKAENVAANIVDRTGSKQIVIQHLDLASLTSITKFVDRIKAQENRIDILINNAGVVYDSGQKTKDGLEYQIGINHIGHFLLTNMLTDLLKKSTPSRIINVSSRAHRHSGRMNFDDLRSQKNLGVFGSYSRSKTANILFSKELGHRLAGTGVVVMALHPGTVRSEIWRNANIFVQLFMYTFGYILCKSNWEGAQTSIHCALVEPSRDMFDGKMAYFSECAEKAPATHADDEEDARRLWEWSEEVLRNRGVQIDA